MSFYQKFLVDDFETKPSLLTIPYEIREKILQLALRQEGSVELQHPVWIGLQVFAQPLFQVCQSLRNEALNAFYESNDFLWIIDAEQQLRSDPTKYPIETAESSLEKNHRSSARVSTGSFAGLTPCLPWQFPDLMHRLRHLRVHIYLPQERDARALQEHLTGLVAALDHGRRLADLYVLVTAKRRAAQIPLTFQERQALEELSAMEVRGRVQVQTRYYFRAVCASVYSMRLDKRMKA